VSAICSQKILAGEVDQITVVQDREGDIYESFCRLKWVYDKNPRNSISLHKFLNQKIL
jgi:hypothetical protein